MRVNFHPNHIVKININISYCRYLRYLLRIFSCVICILGLQFSSVVYAKQQVEHVLAHISPHSQQLGSDQQVKQYANNAQVKSFKPYASSRPQNFVEAKRLARQIFALNPITLYCGCQYSPKSQQIELNSCSYKPTQNLARAMRMEFEHMMPMENIGRNFLCWREKICVHKNGKRYKGRKCCEKIDSKFQQLEADLYNLWPAVGAINQVRSNWRYGMVNSKTCGTSTSTNTNTNINTSASSSSSCSFNFENCPVNIDMAAHVFEPPDSAKGIVARANLYMAVTHNVPLSRAQQQLFLAWNKQHPPTSWECTWAQSVAEIQGVVNPYIAAKCSNSNRKED